MYRNVTNECEQEFWEMKDIHPISIISDVSQGLDEMNQESSCDRVKKNLLSLAIYAFFKL